MMAMMAYDVEPGGLSSGFAPGVGGTSDLACRAVDGIGGEAVPLPPGAAAMRALMTVIVSAKSWYPATFSGGDLNLRFT